MTKDEYFAANYPNATPAFKIGYFTPRDLLGIPHTINQNNKTEKDEYKSGHAAGWNDRANWKSSSSPRP